MNDQTPITPQRTATSIELETLDSASDETLQELIARAKALLTAREHERKREAIAQIKELAKAHGLDVTVDTPKRSRGRPRKKI